MQTHKPYTPKDFAGKLARYFMNSPLTMLLGVTLLAIGYLSLMIMPREENPQMVVSGSTVIVAMPGATAKEVENVIVKPLERKMKEVLGIEHIYGMAMDNVGIVNAAFYIGEEKENSNLKVYDKIMQNADMFPKTAMQPIIKPLDIDVDIPILSVAFYSKDTNKMNRTELYDAVKKIQHHINGLPNVAVTALKGGNKHQYNLEVDLAKLSGYNLSMGQIVQAVQALAYNVPAVKNHSKDNQIVMMGIKNAIESVKDVENIIVAQYMGSAIHLRDVATVTDSYDIQNFRTATISVNEEGTFSAPTSQVTLTVSKLKGTNAVIISEEVKKELDQYKDLLAKNGISYSITRNDGERANEAVNELVFHLLISIVIIAILLIFVLGWRESMIVTFTVPAILAITLFIAYITGQTINRITLFAFLLSLGLLVDAAIIVIENIHRHFHSLESEHQDIDELLVEATDEIGPPTNIATFAIILTMVPMAFVGGMMGQFMKPIPANVPVALIASLFVAYIFTPYMAKRIMKKPNHAKGEH
ncbi:MAG: efflux RND transporter permease subunit [Campylobacterota bacterium]|nr:efflux RND transporter permease subunit [Campylobacterota bacterium]